MVAGLALGIYIYPYWNFHHVVYTLSLIHIWLEAGNRAGMTVIGLATTNPEEQIRDKAKAVKMCIRDRDIADLQQYGKGSSNFKGYAYDMLQFIGKLCGGMAPDDFTQQLKKTVIYTDYTHDPTSSLYRIDAVSYTHLDVYKRQG